MTSFDVENVTLRLLENDIVNITSPFISQITGSSGDEQYFTVVKAIANDSVTYLNKTGKWITTPLKTFTKLSTGIIFLIEPSETAGEKDYSSLRKAELQKTILTHIGLYSIPILAAIICILNLSLAPISVGGWALLNVLNATGAFLSCLLVLYEVDVYNPALRRLCTSGAKTSCTEVITSSHSAFFGISWSILGFSYFTSNLIILILIGGNDSPLFSLLKFINLGSLTYVIYSVYVQWKIIKKWCLLCLAIQMVIMCQGILIIFSYNFNYLNWGILVDFLTILPIYLLSLIAASTFSSALKKNKIVVSKRSELLAFKYDISVFQHLLLKEKKVKLTPLGLGLFLGHENAKYQIIKVCNPYCEPCAEAHRPIEKLLEKDLSLSVQIIFTASNLQTDIRKLPVSHLLNIDEHFDKIILRDSLNGWYSQEEKNYESFADKHPSNGTLDKYDLKISNMHDWCSENEIKFTPTFFVNGYQLPHNYTAEDLKFLISV